MAGPREGDMMFVDLPLEELHTLRPEVALPPDFDAFWARQLSLARGLGGDAEVAETTSPLAAVTAYDVTFPGHGGAPIRGWLSLPHRLAPRAPLVVEYVGYGGGRGDVLDHLLWPAVGYAHFVMDSRGQGGGWRTADTPDPGDDGAPGAAGFLAKGLYRPEDHYYTRLIVDAARAVDALRAHPLTADRPVVALGASQGGGLALAVAHLAGGMAACLPEAPFLADIARAVRITDARPYAEIATYCRLHPDRAERAFATLGYLDAANHARRATAPALFGVGLRDEVTPPSTVFAAYHLYAGVKDIAVYPYAGHEGGGIPHRRAQLDFLAAALTK